MANRVINFFDGSDSSTSPTVGNVSASDLVKYPDDATFESSESGAPIGGNIYYNTTTDTVRYYSDSIPGWVNVVSDNVVDSTFTISDDVDTSKKMQFQVSLVSTGITRVYTVPDEDTVLVGTGATQTLTNKTIDADLNTINNLEHGNEVDDPSSGVHGVTGDVVGTTDSQTLTNKTIGDDLDIQGTTSSTDETNGALTVAGGVGVGENLNVGGDLTVEGDLTVNGTTTTVNTAELDVEDENITINKNGTQATADDAAGLTVEMSDATDVKLLYDKDTTSRWRAGDSGSEEEIVTANHAQRITAKDIDLGTASDDVGITVSSNTTANLEALTREAGRVYWSTDDEQYYGDDGVDLVPIGSGGGGGGELNFYILGDAEAAKLADFTTGNDATFDGGGTLAGTFSLSETATDLIRGNVTHKYIQSSTAGDNDDDYIASAAFSIPQGYRGRFFRIKLNYRFDGTDDNVKWVVWDNTNSVDLSGSSAFVKNYEDSTTFTSQKAEFILFIPSDCEELKFGPKVITGEADVVLTWDDVVVTPNITLSQDLIKLQSAEIVSTASSATSGVIDGVALTGENGDGLFSYNSVSGEFTILKDCKLDMSFYVRSSGGTAGASIIRDATTLATDFGSGGTQFATTSVNCNAVAGEVYTFSTQDGYDNFSIFVSAIGSAEHVVTPAMSNVTDWETYSPTTQGFGTPSFDYVKYKKIGDTGLIKFKLSLGTTTGDEAQFGLPSDWTVDADDPEMSGVFTRGGSVGGNNGGIIWATDGDNYVTFSANSVWGTANVDSESFVAGNVVGSSGQTIAGYATVKLQGESSNAIFLAAIPTLETAYIKDVKAAGTNGGTFTAGAWQTRDLNTLEGDTGFVGLSSNQFTLQPGKYDIEATGTARQVQRHKVKIRDITNSSDSIIGDSAFTASSNSITSISSLKGQLLITEPTVYELQHRCEATNSGDGFGTASNFGVDEVYSIIKITKVK